MALRNLDEFNKEAIARKMQSDRQKRASGCACPLCGHELLEILGTKHPDAVKGVNYISVVCSCGFGGNKVIEEELKVESLNEEPFHE